MSQPPPGGTALFREIASSIRAAGPIPFDRFMEQVGQAAERIGPLAEKLETLATNVDEVVRVTDDEVARAMKALYVDTHNVAEGAGAASLAGALKRRDSLRGRKVGLTLCGANVDSDVFSRVLAGGSH